MGSLSSKPYQLLETRRTGSEQWGGPTGNNIQHWLAHWHWQWTVDSGQLTCLRWINITAREASGPGPVCTPLCLLCLLTFLCCDSWQAEVPLPTEWVCRTCSCWNYQQLGTEKANSFFFVGVLWNLRARAGRLSKPGNNKDKLTERERENPSYNFSQILEENDGTDLCWLSAKVSAAAEDQCLVILSRFYCIILRFCQIQKLWKSFLDFNNNIFLLSIGKGDCQVKALIQWLQLFPRGERSLAAMSGRIYFFKKLNFH